MNNNPTSVNEGDRLAPHSANAEAAVLGSILINPEVLLEVSTIISPADFFIVRNVWVFEAMQALYNQGEAIDTLTLAQKLLEQNRLEQIGGSAYLVYLANNTPTHIHAETYAHIVERAAARRRLLSTAQEIGRLALIEDLELDEMYRQFNQIVDHVGDNLKDDDHEIDGKDAAREHYDLINERYEHPETAQGIMTGFTDLDAILGGVSGGDVIFVPARPSVGKSALLLNIMLNILRVKDERGAPKYSTAMFTLEMDTEELMHRVFSSETGINSQKIKTAQMSSFEWSQYTEAVVRVGKYLYRINDNSSINIRQIKNSCRKIQRKRGLDVVFIDYVQLMGSEEKAKERVQELSKLTRDIKKMAKELDVVVIAAAQINRNVESRQDKRPMLSDIRESGSFEQDADIVAFIYRDEMYNKDSEAAGTAEIIVSKHRNGPTGTAVLNFDLKTTTFSNRHVQYISLRSEDLYPPEGE